MLADLSVDAVQLQMTSIAMSLQEIGYSIQVVEAWISTDISLLENFACSILTLLMMKCCCL